MKARDLNHRFEVLSRSIEEVGRKKRSLDESINKVVAEMNSVTAEMKSHRYSGDKSRYNNIFINQYNSMLKLFESFKMEKNKLNVSKQMPQWVNPEDPDANRTTERPAEPRPDRRQSTGKPETIEENDTDSGSDGSDQFEEMTENDRPRRRDANGRWG